MKSFDYKTHLRNKKGKVYAVQPYKMYVNKNGTKFERPPNSGIFFNADGSPMEKQESKINPEIKPMKVVEPILDKVKIQAKQAEIKSKVKVEVKGEIKK